MAGRLFPLSLDPDHAKSVKPGTLERYKSALQKFLTFLHSEDLKPQTFDELDAMIVHYKQQRLPTRANFEVLLAALEFFFPHARGQLLWSKRVGKGLAIQQETHHAIPLPLAPAKFLAVLLSSRGLTRLGVGLIVQCLTGLRPSELLQLQKNHVIEEGDKFIFRLGVKGGTKLKREQRTWLAFDRDEDVTCLFRRILLGTEAGEKLWDHSYNEYRLALRLLSRQLGLPFSFTPHSARAGFASEAVSRGEDAQSIRIRGRWQSETSFRIYTDVVGASLVKCMDGMSSWQNHIVGCSLHLRHLFPGTFRHHGKGSRTRSWFDRGDVDQFGPAGGADENYDGHRVQRPQSEGHGRYRLVKATKKKG